MGFCMGGRHVLRAMSRLPHDLAACAALHPSFIVIDEPDSPHLVCGSIEGEPYLRFGETDRARPRAAARHGITHTIDVHQSAGHGYMLSGRTYLPGAAERSWERMLELFRRALREAPVPS